MKTITQNQTNDLSEMFNILIQNISQKLTKSTKHWNPENSKL